MRRIISLRRFSTRLLLGFVVLIFLTTLSAGVPAFLLTRFQLERQAWSQVESAQRTARYLLEAENTHLTNQLVLLTERPTLERLVLEQSTDPLQRYLGDFEQQSGLDMLLFCDSENVPLTGDRDQIGCISPLSQGLVILDGRPAMLARQDVIDNESGEPLGAAVAGIWLDETFLERLAAATGTQQSILQPDGTRLVSSFAAAGTSADLADRPRQLTMNDNAFYAAYSPLAGGDGQTALISEVALNVEEMVSTEQNAFFILAASTGLITLLGVLLSGWFVRQVNAPLKRLTASAEKISQGDLMAAIPLISAPAEVRTLAGALHRSQASMLEALQERSELGERLNTLLQSVVEGVITYDTSGRITFWSEGAGNILGWTPDVAVGRDVNELFRLADGTGATFLEQVPPTGQKKQISVLARGVKPVVLDLTSSQLVPPGDDSVRVALVFRDVTEEEAVRRLRSYFLANISHEFRTPLSTLIASMELLLNENEDYSLAEVRQLLNPTHVSMLSLQTLIDNLLESSSIEAGRFTLRLRRFQMQEATQASLDISQPFLDRRGQSFILTAPEQPVEVEGDPVRLTQALVNLIINASKYSPTGSQIELKIEQREDTLWVGVFDQGPGIPPAERSNLFRSFVRRDTGDQEEYGIGLGLYVVKTVVEAHGGQVGVGDSPVRGSLFWFEIPLRQEKITS